MSWLPEPQVTLDGVDVTGVTVEQVSLRRGRNRVYEEASAGYATVRLLADDSFPVPNVGAELGLLIDPGVTVDASGGDEVFDATTRDGTFQVHRFTSVGTATFTLNNPAVVDVLTVGGGGAGFLGGGGAGGLRIDSTFLAAGSYTVVVGGGGGAFAVPEASSFDGFVAPGGANGRSAVQVGLAGVGGSGGGGASRNGFVDSLPGLGIVPFGNGGGAALGEPDDFDNSGGGGGFRAAGGDATAVRGGDGGRGVLLDFDGVTRDYASGGGGATVFDATVAGVGSKGGGASGGDGGYAAGPSPNGILRQPKNGQANTGGGGGGGTVSTFGGSGVVIVRVPKKLTAFRGSVSDVQVQAIATNNGLLFSYDVTAVGPIALLSRQRVFFDGRSVELDGARISDAIAEGLTVSWGEYPDQQWNQVPEDTTWLNLDPVFSLANIDRGAFDLAAFDARAEGFGALTVVNESALSGRGVLFETPGGVLGYADRRRRIRQSGSDPVVLSFNDVEVNSFSTAASVGDVTNVADVTWAAGVVSATNTDGIRDLFRLERSFTTVLNEESDAQAFADDVVDTQGVARVRIQEVRINLLGLDSEQAREELLRLPIGRSIRVTDVPSPLGSGVFDGFVEGVEFSAGTFEARLALLVSDLRFSVPEFDPVVATGGDEVFDWVRQDNGVLSRAHVFFGADDFVVTAGGTVEYVIIAGGGGGGGGGGSANTGSGGGGAGGVLTGSFDVVPGSYPVTVGAGGLGIPRTVDFQGNNGGSSTLFGLTAVGGGGGGAAFTAQDGRAGGSGGGGGADGSTQGAGGAGTAGQGFAGGAGATSGNGGGGGGAGGAGLTAVVEAALGGPGVPLVVTPFTLVAGSGGAGSDPSTGVVRSGVPDTGEGGQGSSQTEDGGDGGSGLVLVVYPLEPL